MWKRLGKNDKHLRVSLYTDCLVFLGSHSTLKKLEWNVQEIPVEYKFHDDRDLVLFTEVSPAPRICLAHTRHVLHIFIEIHY